MSNACGFSITELKHPSVCGKTISQQIIDYVNENSEELVSFLKNEDGTFSRENAEEIVNMHYNYTSMNEKLIEEANQNGDDIVGNLLGFLNSDIHDDVEILTKEGLDFSIDDTPLSVQETYKKFGSISNANKGLQLMKWGIFNAIIDSKNGYFYTSADKINERINVLKKDLYRSIFNNNASIIQDEDLESLDRYYDNIENSANDNMRIRVVCLHNFDTIISDILKIGILKVKRNPESIYMSRYELQTKSNLSSGVSYETNDQFYRDANDFTKFIISSLPFHHHVPTSSGLKPIGNPRYMSYPVFARTLSKIKSYCNSFTLKISDVLKNLSNDEIETRLKNIYDIHSDMTLSELYSLAYFNPVEYMNDLFVILNKANQLGKTHGFDSTTFGVIKSLTEWLFDGYTGKDNIKRKPLANLLSSKNKDLPFSIIDDIAKIFQSTDTLNYYGIDLSFYSDKIRMYNTSLSNIRSMYESNVLARLNAITSMKNLFSKYKIDYNIDVNTDENGALSSASLTFDYIINSNNKKKFLTININKDDKNTVGRHMEFDDPRFPVAARSMSDAISDILGFPSDSLLKLFGQESDSGSSEINDEFIYNCKTYGMDIKIKDILNLLSYPLLSYELCTNEYAGEGSDASQITSSTKNILNKLKGDFKFDPVRSNGIMKLRPFVNAQGNSASMSLESLSTALNATLLGDVSYVNTLEGKRYFEQITHRLMTSAIDIYNVEHRNNANSPVRDSCIFKYGILESIGQMVEVKNENTLMPLTKMSENDLTQTLYVKNIVEQLFNTTRSGGYVYVNPTVLSDKPIVLVLKSNIDTLKKYIASIGNFNIKNNSIALNRLQKSILSNFKEFDNRKIDFELTSPEGIENLKNAIRYENLSYLVRQKESIDNDIESILNYSDVKINNESDLLNVVKEYNNDLLGTKKLTSLFVLGKEGEFNEYIQNRYGLELSYQEIIEQYGNIGNFIDSNVEKLYSYGFRNKIDLISDFHYTADKKGNITFGNSNIDKLINIYSQHSITNDYLKELELLSINNLLNSGFSIYYSEGENANKSFWENIDDSYKKKSGLGINIAIAGVQGKKNKEDITIPIFSQSDLRYFRPNKPIRGEKTINEKGDVYIKRKIKGVDTNVAIDGTWVEYNDPEFSIEEWCKYQKQFFDINVNVDSFHLNPFLKSATLISQLISESYINTTCGNTIHYKGNGKSFSHPLSTNKFDDVIAMLDAKNITAVKRMTNLSAQKTRPVSGTKHGIPTRHGKPTVQIALFDDAKIKVSLPNQVEDKEIVVDNGATNECFLYTIWKRIGLTSDGIDNPVSKDFYSFVHPNHGVVGIIKTANFALDNEAIINSPTYYNLNKVMMSTKWDDQINILKGELLSYKAQFDAGVLDFDEIKDDNLLFTIFDAARSNGSSDIVYDIIKSVDDNYEDILSNYLVKLIKRSETAKNINGVTFQIGDVELIDAKQRLYEITWSHKKGAINMNSVTEQHVIDSAFTLWEALGGTNSYTNGVRSSQSFYDVANILDDMDVLDNVRVSRQYSTLEKGKRHSVRLFNQTEIEGQEADKENQHSKDIRISYQFGKHAIVSLMTSKEAMKTYQTNLNNASRKYFGKSYSERVDRINSLIKEKLQHLFSDEEITVENFENRIAYIDPLLLKDVQGDIENILWLINNIKINSMTKDIISSGRQNDATHIVNESDVATPSQVIYLSTGTGELCTQADALFSAIHSMIYKKIGDIFRESEGSIHGDIDGLKNILTNKIAEVWSKNADGSESDIKNAIINKFQNEKEIVESFDNMSIFYDMVTTLGSFITKNTSKFRLDDSSMSVLMPSTINIHDGKLRSKFGDTIDEQTEKLKKLQTAIENQLIGGVIEEDGLQARVETRNLILEREGKSIFREFSRLNFECPYIVYEINDNYDPNDPESTKYNRIDEFIINNYNDYKEFKKLYGNSNRYCFVENIVEGHKLLADSIIFKDETGKSFNIYDTDIVQCLMSFKDGQFNDKLFNNLIEKYGTLCLSNKNVGEIIEEFINDKISIGDIDIKNKIKILQEMYKRQLLRIKNGMSVSIDGVDVIPVRGSFEFRKCQAVGSQKNNFLYELHEGQKRIPELPLLSDFVCDGSLLTKDGKVVFFKEGGLSQYVEDYNSDSGVHTRSRERIRKGREFKLGNGLSTDLYIEIGRGRKKKKFPVFSGHNNIERLLDGNTFYNIKFQNEEVKNRLDPTNLSQSILDKKDDMNESLKVTDLITKMFIALRTPSQNKQSCMAMEMVDTLESLNNNVFVSDLQLLLQGSDFDIDKITMLMFTRDTYGIFEHWSNIVSSSDYIVFKESLKMPYPSGEQCSVSYDDNVENINIEAFEILGNYLNENNMTFEEYVNKITDFKNLHSNDISLLDNFIEVLDSIAKNNNIYIPNEFRDSNANKLINLINRHNLSEETEGSIQNFMVSKLIHIFTSPEAWVEAHSEMSLTNLKNAIKNINDIHPHVACPGVIDCNSRNISNVHAGKDGIGMVATANKGIMSVFHASEKAYQTGDARDKEHATFNVSITYKGKTYNRSSILGTEFKTSAFNIEVFKEILKDESLLSNIKDFCGGYIDIRSILLFASTCKIRNRKKVANALKTYINLFDNQIVKNAINNDQSWNQDENKENITESMTAATDNAKEMLLHILNAGNDTLSLYTYCLAIDLPLSTIVDIMNNPVSRYIAEKCKGSLYTNESKKSFLEVLNAITNENVYVPDSIISYINRELDLGYGYDSTLNNLFGNKKNNKLDKNAMTVLCQKLNIESENATSSDTQNKVFRSLMEICMNSNEKNVVSFAVKNKIKSDVYQIASATKTPSELFDVLKNISTGAAELTTLAVSFLSRNQGITIGVNDDIAYFSRIGNIFTEKTKDSTILNKVKEATKTSYLLNDGIEPLDDKLLEKGIIDIRLLAVDNNYFNQLEDIYEQIKHTVNPFFVLRNTPHMFDYFKAQCIKLHGASVLSNTYSELLTMCSSVFDEYNIKKAVDKKKTSRSLLRLRNAYTIDLAMFNNQLLFQKGTGDAKRVIIPKGTTIRIDDSTTVQTPANIPVKLGNNFAKMAFKSMFEQFIINNQRSSEWEGLKHFTLISKKNGPFKTNIQYLTPKIDLHDKDNSNVQLVFEDVYKLSQKIIPGTNEVNENNKEIPGTGLTFSEGLILYNYIVHLNERSSDTFSKLIDSVFPGHYLTMNINNAIMNEIQKGIILPEDLKMIAALPVITRKTIRDSYKGSKAIYNAFPDTEPIIIEKKRRSMDYDGFDEDEMLSEVMEDFSDIIGEEFFGKKVGSNKDFSEEGWSKVKLSEEINPFYGLRYGVTSSVVSSYDNKLYSEYTNSNGDNITVTYESEKTKVTKTNSSNASNSNNKINDTKETEEITIFVPKKIKINNSEYNIKFEGNKTKGFKVTLYTNIISKGKTSSKTIPYSISVYNPFSKRTKFDFDIITNAISEIITENRNKCNIG